MSEKIRIGLLGYGKVAGLHAEAVQSVLNGCLVSVAGRNKTRRNEFAEKWKISSRETAAEMAELDKVDLVIVNTPHPQHCEGAIEALSAGCHVLVEKPMAVTTAECDKMIAAAGKAGKILSVISQRRWFPACRRIRDAIDSGKLGKPSLLQLSILGWRDEAYYKSDPWRGKWSAEGGGILINQAAHQIDIMNWFMGPIKEIHGYWDNFNHPYIEVEDSAVAVLKFNSGGLGSVLVSNSQKPGIYAKVHVHGSSGASAGVQTDGGAMFIAGISSMVEPPLNDLWTIPGEENLLDKFRQEDEEFFKTLEAKAKTRAAGSGSGSGSGSATSYFFTQQIEDLCASILEGKEPAVKAEDGRETVKFIETMYKLGGAPGY